MKIHVKAALFIAAFFMSGCGYTAPGMGSQGVYNPYLVQASQSFQQNPYLGDPGLIQGNSQGSYYSQNTPDYSNSSYNNVNDYKNNQYGYASTDSDNYLPETSQNTFATNEAIDAINPTPTQAPSDQAPLPIPAAQFSSVSDELNILTLNVWGLPGPLVEDRKERFERLGAQLNAYDVVTLQETFSDDIEILKKTTGFAYHSRNDNGNFYRLGSGLYTLSKYPIIKTDFMSFGSCTVADCLARKGVYFTRIDHPVMGPIDIYTTHYQAEDKETSKRIRIQEDNRVLQEIVHRNRSEFPVIITGDFNFIPDLDEYTDLMARLPLVDSFRQVHPDQAGYTSHPDNPYKTGKTPERLDYIFYLPKNNVEYSILSANVTLNQPVDDYVLSDHYGVAARFQIKTRKPID